MKTAFAYFLLCVGIPQMGGLVLAIIPSMIIRGLKMPFWAAQLIWPELIMLGLFSGAGGAVCAYWMFHLFGLAKLIWIPIVGSAFYAFYSYSYNKRYEWIGQIIGFWICWILLKCL